MKKWLWGLVILSSSAVAIIWFSFFSERRPSLSVPADFATISLALQQANPGDTIKVDANGGPYQEAIIVRVNDLELVSVNGTAKLLSLSADQPIIMLLADHVKIAGFTFAAASPCMDVFGAEHIMIEDNVFKDCDVAMSIRQSRNSTIQRNRMENNRSGILVHDAENNRFLNNSVSDNSDTGIDILRSAHNHFEGNKILDSYVGIRLNEAHFNYLLKNEVKDSRFEGILLLESRSNRIVENSTVLNFDGISLGSGADDNDISLNRSQMNTHSGITLTQANNNEVRNNLFEANEQGILLINASYNLIEANEVNTNLESGIMLKNAAQNTVRDNTASGNDKGIATTPANDNMIVDNYLHHNEVAIFMSSSTGNTIQGNRLESNQTGVEIGFSKDNLFKDNWFSRHAAAILITESNKNTFVSNVIDSNQYGINLLFSQENTILFNSFNNNTRSAASFINFSSNNRFSQNELSDNEWGVLIASSASNDIELNTIRNNKTGIVLNKSGPGTQIKGNEIVDNEIGIQLPEFLSKEATILADSTITLEVTGSDEGYLIRNNLIANNKDVGILNQKREVVFAQGNAWNVGGETGQLREKLTRGNVELLGSRAKGPLFISSENNVEQRILGAMLKLTLEAHGFFVVDMTNLGDSEAVAQALTGDIVDMAWLNTDLSLQRFGSATGQLDNNLKQIKDFISKNDEQKNGLLWLKCAPADTSVRLAISSSQEFAIRAHGLNIAAEDPQTIADISLIINTSEIMPVIALPESFVHSAASGGMQQFGQAYGINWEKAEVELLTYDQAVTELSFGGVDLAMIRNSAPEIDILNLRVLEDSERFFWNSRLCPVLREEVARDFPELTAIFDSLAEALTLERLRNLNGKVIFFGEPPENVARQFLINHNLL